MSDGQQFHAILLDGIERDLSAEAPSMPEDDPDGPENRKKKKPRFTNHGWWAGEGDWVAYNWPNPEAIKSVRIVLDSDLSMDKRMLCRYPKDQPSASMPPMLARDLDIECCDRRGNWHTACKIRDNRKRLIQLNQTQEGATGCRLRIVRT